MFQIFLLIELLYLFDYVNNTILLEIPERGEELRGRGQGAAVAAGEERRSDCHDALAVRPGVHRIEVIRRRRRADAAMRGKAEPTRTDTCEHQHSKGRCKPLPRALPSGNGLDLPCEC